VFLVLTYYDHGLLINLVITTYMTAAATILQKKPSICVHHRRNTHPPVGTLTEKDYDHTVDIWLPS
jgi:hypothetical protein